MERMPAVFPPRRVFLLLSMLLAVLWILGTAAMA